MKRKSVRSFVRSRESVQACLKESISDIRCLPEVLSWFELGRLARFIYTMHPVLLTSVLDAGMMRLGDGATKLLDHQRFKLGGRRVRGDRDHLVGPKIQLLDELVLWMKVDSNDAFVVPGLLGRDL